MLATNHFRNQHAELRDTNPPAATGLAAAIRYLAEHGRSAVAPDVKWSFTTSI